MAHSTGADNSGVGSLLFSPVNKGQLAQTQETGNGCLAASSPSNRFFFFFITSKSENLCVQGDKSSSNLSSLFNLIMKVPIPYHSNTLIC